MKAKLIHFSIDCNLERIEMQQTIINNDKNLYMVPTCGGVVIYTMTKCIEYRVFVENINLINIFLKFVVQLIEFKPDSLEILIDHPNLVLGI
jgi:exoribonuclease II